MHLIEKIYFVARSYNITEGWRMGPKTGVSFWNGAIDSAVSLGIYYAIEVSARCLFNFDADELGLGVNYGRDMPMADYGNGPFVAVNCAFLQARPVSHDRVSWKEFFDCLE